MSVLDFIPIFSAVILLIGGALIFRWHRAIERESEMLLERRGLYAALIRSRYELREALSGTDQSAIVTRVTNYKIKRDALLVYSPDKIAAGVEAHSNSLGKLWTEHRSSKNEAKKLMNSLLMRQNCS